MKIYEIGTGYTPIPAQMGAATEIVVEELVKAFQKDGADVTLVDIQARERQENNLPIVEVKVPAVFSGTDVKLGVIHKLKRVVYSVSLARTLKQILHQSQEQVILHFHNQYNLYFFYKLVSKKLQKKARIAYTVHSYIWPAAWEEIRDVVRKRYFQEIYCVRHADRVLVLNQRTAEHFVTHLGVAPEKICHIGNGVNTDVYHPMRPEMLAKEKAALGLENKKVILQVGSVCDRKNQLGAAEMLTQYLRDHEDVVYAYAGGIIDPEYQERIMQLAAENGIDKQIRYAGELCPGKQLNAYYNAASVTVFPSKLESFGLVIIESLSAGTPVIMAEKPLFALETGCFVYASKEEYIRLINELLNAPEKDLQARSEVMEKYSWDKTAKDHIKIWEA